MMCRLALALVLWVSATGVTLGDGGGRLSGQAGRPEPTPDSPIALADADNPAPTPAPKTPAWVAYSFFFAHLENLDRVADDQAALGHDDAAGQWRTYEQRLAGLDPSEGDLLRQVGRDCREAVRQKDEALRAAVAALRAQYPNGYTAGAAPPAQLRTLWQERVAIIDQQVDRLRSLLGDERFQTLDRYVQAKFLPGHVRTSSSAPGVSPRVDR